MKKVSSLFLIGIVFLVLFNCDNSWMGEILQKKTITFNSNGGSYVRSQSVYGDEKITKPPEPTRNGYNFEYWYTVNENIEKEWDFDKIPDKDMTLYARWTYIGTPEPDITNITIKTLPRLQYTHGETLDLSGLVVTVTYKNNTTGDVAFAGFGEKGIGTEPADGSTLIHTVHDNTRIMVSVPSDTEYIATPLMVDKATPTIYFPTAASITYPATLSTSVLTGGSTTLGSFAWQNGEFNPNAGNGNYDVVFTPNDKDNYDYSSVPGWRQEDSIVVRSVSINVSKGTQTINDFTISAHWEQSAGNVTPVTISPNAGISRGDITIYYTGTNDTTYTKSRTPPQLVGTYAVTFDVDADENWNAASGLSAGTLTVNNIFNSADALKNYLEGLVGGNFNNPYNIVLNVDNFDGIKDVISPQSTGNPPPALKYINLDLSGSAITSIPESAFSNCKNLVGVTIPDGVIRIEAYAFDNCGLTRITIPSSVTNIGTKAFAGISLNEVTFNRAVIIFSDDTFPPGSSTGSSSSLYQVYSGNGGGIGTYKLDSSSGWVKQP